jgi:signal transduction histidine kinase
VAQEALHNVAKHAQATHVRVQLATTGDLAELTVTDDGAGFDPSAPPSARRSLGITSMRERALLLGGACTVASAPGAGTTVQVRIPISGTVER